MYEIYVILHYIFLPFIEGKVKKKKKNSKERRKHTRTRGLYRYNRNE